MKVNLTYIRNVYGCPKCKELPTGHTWKHQNKVEWIFKSTQCLTCGWKTRPHLTWKGVWREYWHKIHKKIKACSEKKNCHYCKYFEKGERCFCRVDGADIIDGKYAKSCPLSQIFHPL